MDNQKNIQNKKDRTENREELFHSNDNNFVFVPVENIRAIEQVIVRYEAVRKQWNKMWIHQK